MRPLLFVNWSMVAARFTMLMWLIAIVLALVVLAHLVGDSGGSAAGMQAAPAHPAVALRH